MGAERPLPNRIADLRRRWKSITEIPAQPRSVMSVIEYGLGKQRRAEVYVNRLLRYFLDSDEPHGMGTDFMQAFLKGLPSECEFREDLYELSAVEVDEQVSIKQLNPKADGVDNRGLLDLLIEVRGEWFLLVELKFSAEETGTTFYCNADTIGGRPKTDYESGEYYLYLHQADEPEASGSCFVNWT